MDKELNFTYIYHVITDAMSTGNCLQKIKHRHIYYWHVRISVYCIPVISIVKCNQRPGGQPNFQDYVNMYIYQNKEYRS